MNQNTNLCYWLGVFSIFSVTAGCTGADTEESGEEDQEGVGQSALTSTTPKGKLALGGSHSCAINGSGQVKCWGSNQSGQLGDGSGSNQSSAVPVSNATGLITAVAVVAGATHTCALTGMGRVYCWGDNSSGQVGNNSPNFIENLPRLVVIDTINTPLQSIVAITAGAYHTCAVSNVGAVRCWGANDMGQLGADPNAGFFHTFADAMPALGTSIIKQVTAGASHTCARSSTNGVLCWGDNSYGQLAQNTAQFPWTYVPYPMSGITATIVQAGSHFTCTVAPDNTGKCWGEGTSGQLATCYYTSTTVPTAIFQVNDIQAIASGDYHTCVVRATGSGTVTCAGKGISGQLGNGASVNNAFPVGGTPANPGVLEPTNVALAGAQDVAAGGDHSCAYMANGTVKCWGSNLSGQLGSNNGVNQLKAVLVQSFP